MAISHRDFFTAVLRGLGAPVTENNLLKLAAVARQEGGGGSFNPFNYVSGPGTNFNKVGVKNYPDVTTGITQTIRLLSQGNTAAMRANLLVDGGYADWLGRTSNFYRSWGGGPIKISSQNAAAQLGRPISGGPGGSLAALPSTMSGTLDYRNWVGSGWAAASQYKGKGLSPYLQGMMTDLLRRYPDTQNWGGYNYRPAKGSPALPSAHAFGAAIDWGYGKDRAAANQVISMLTSDPYRYGIQQIHDYVNSRTWKAGKGWVQERVGSGGGDMGRPTSTWLHLEVAPSRYGSQWGGSAPATGTTAPTMPRITLPPPPALFRPSVSTLPPLTQMQLTRPAVPRPDDLGYYSSARGVPTAAETLARTYVQNRRF